MADPTLANPSRQSLANIARPFSRITQSKSQPEFRVLSTGEAEYHWRIAALATNRTISRHKSLGFALKKCARLNQQQQTTASDPLAVALSGFPNVSSYRAYYEGVENDSK